MIKRLREASPGPAFPHETKGLPCGPFRGKDMKSIAMTMCLLRTALVTQSEFTGVCKFLEASYSNCSRRAAASLTVRFFGISVGPTTHDSYQILGNKSLQAPSRCPSSHIFGVRFSSFRNLCVCVVAVCVLSLARVSGRWRPPSSRRCCWLLASLSCGPPGFYYKPVAPPGSIYQTHPTRRAAKKRGAASAVRRGKKPQKMAGRPLLLLSLSLASAASPGTTPTSEIGHSWPHS